jgi:hypothetical protein
VYGTVSSFFLANITSEGILSFSLFFLFVVVVVIAEEIAYFG